VQKANRIVVIEDGNVVESGSHSELVKKGGGKYAAMLRMSRD
jgi:ABC-type multidrug transport system fused ATPase/permease subunit